MVLQEIDCAHDHARSTEPALQRVMFAKTLLHRMKGSVGFRDSFDRDEVAALRLHRDHVAGLHRAAVQVDRASATLRRIAANVGPGEAQFIPDELDEERALLDLRRDGPTVHGHGNADCHEASSKVGCSASLGSAIAATDEAC